MHIYISFTLGLFLLIYVMDDIIDENSNFIIYNKKHVVFSMTFMILSFLSFFRDGIGVDYPSYIYHIKLIGDGIPSYMEIGFQFLSRFIMVLTGNPKYVIGIAGVITCYYFVKSIFDQSINIKMSVFIFLTWGYYFYTFNSIRYYLALSMCLFSVKYINKNEIIKFIIIVIFGSLFHKSALICIPAYLLANKRFDKKGYLLVISIAVLMWLLKDYIRDLIFLFYPSYEGSVYDNSEVSILNILKSLSILFVSFLVNNKIRNSSKLNLMFNLNLFALLIYTFLYWIPETSRIGFYFNITSIIYLPSILDLQNKERKKLLSTIVYVLSFMLFITLISRFDDSTINLLPYKFWNM